MKHHDSTIVDVMMPRMRTTVTLDPDVAAKLKEETRKRGISFKEALNSSVRRGLERGEAKPRPYRLPPPQRMGARPGVNLDKALQLAGELEDAEIMRKLQLGK
jgi:ribbon-helix-helix CopG family protein